MAIEQFKGELGSARNPQFTVKALEVGAYGVLGELETSGDVGDRVPLDGHRRDIGLPWRKARYLQLFSSDGWLDPRRLDRLHGNQEQRVTVAGRTKLRHHESLSRREQMGRVEVVSKVGGIKIHPPDYQYRAVCPEHLHLPPSPDTFEAQNCRGAAEGHAEAADLMVLVEPVLEEPRRN